MGGRVDRDLFDRVVPGYEPIADLAAGGESFHYGGERLCEDDRFPTADGRARFCAIELLPPPPDDGRLLLSTRRGKQFNSIVQERGDALTGADRDAVLISAGDAERLDLRQGSAELVRSDHGELRARVLLAPIAPGNAQVHWPEGNVLIGGGRSPEAGIPDYNARVEVVAERP
jgi:anaerobic selenocysteine-containing dehydrogenase